MDKCDWDELAWLYRIPAERLTPEQQDRCRELRASAEGLDEDLDVRLWFDALDARMAARCGRKVA